MSAQEGWLERLIDGSVRNRVLVLALTLLGLLLGLRLASGLRFDAFPDLTNVQVQVLTASPGLGSEEVELLVTLPVERSLAGVPGLAQLRSLSRPGISAVTVVFEDGMDPWLARQVVKERVDLARGDIPPMAGQPEIAPPTTGLGEVYQFTLASDRHTRPELYRIFERDVAPRLRAVSGVVEVNAWGAGSPQIDVRFDPYALAARGIPLSEAQQTLSEALGIVSGGSVVRGAEQDAVRGQANPQTPAEVAEIALRGEGADVLRVGDVAEVVAAGALPVGLGTADGQGEVLFGMVQLLSGADARATVAGVTEVVEVLTPTLPEGVELVEVYDREKLVGSTLHTVATSLTEGGLLVVLVLLLVLGDLRSGLLVASVIPLSMVGALAGLSVLGISGNLMSLGAIDFGLVVDGTVVVVESIVAMQLAGELTREAVAERARHVARPVLFAVGILVVVYVPVLAMQGTEGKLFRPMAVTVLLALCTALVLTFTYVPAMASWVIRPHGEHKTPLIRAANAVYRPLLHGAMARPVLAGIAALGLVALSGALGTQLGVAFVPRLEEGDLVLQTERLPSISPEAARLENLRVERVIRAFPEVRRVASRTGSPAVATDPMGLHESDILIQLAPMDTWTTAETTEGLTQAMAEAVRREAPGAALTFTQPIEMRFQELLEGVPSDVGVEIYGRDLDAMLQTGREIATVLEGLDGAADVRAPSVDGLPTLEASVDPVRAGRQGIAAEEVLAMVEAVQVGREVGSVFRGQWRDPVVTKVATPPGVEVGDLPLVRAGGGLTVVSAVADVVMRDAPASVRRQKGSRRVVVQANVRGRDLGAFVREAREAVAAVPLPEGAWLEWAGKYEQLTAAVQRTAILLPVVLVVVLGLLRASFGSMRPAWLIFGNVPVAASGGVLALTLRDLPISMSAIVGFIALFGIAVMNGVVLLSRVQELMEDHPVEQAVRLGALERFRPVLTTATVAGIGFLPMAMAHGMGAEVQRPLATVVIGGLITATALTLVVLPALATRVLRAPEPEAS